jgi:hydrogenase/urease accessory protein HupE
VGVSIQTRAFGPGLLMVLVLILSVPTQAHDPGLSSLDVRIGDSEILTTLSLADADARALNLLTDLLDVRADGLPLRGQIGVRTGSESVPSRLRVDSDPVTTLEMRFAGGARERLAITSHIPVRLTRGHRQLVSIRTQDGRLLAEQMIDATANTVVVELARTENATDLASRFFSLGLHHIVTGYDHVLFLIGLLLAVKGIRDAATIITAFTAAHAVALGLAVAGALSVPPQIVEPLIATSVVWVGIENLVRRTARRRWRPAFAFGLIHGLAFADALSELGAAGSGGALGLRLAFFNAGIEAGQLALSSAIVPLVASAQRWPTLVLVAQRAGSACVVFAGAYWLLHRLPGS